MTGVQTPLQDFVQIFTVTDSRVTSQPLQPRLIEPLNITGSGFQSNREATFKVENTGPIPVNVSRLFVAVRDADGAIRDFSPEFPGTLPPGATHPYREFKSFPPGQYRAWPAYETTFGGVSRVSRVSGVGDTHFTVIATPTITPTRTFTPSPTLTPTPVPTGTLSGTFYFDYCTVPVVCPNYPNPPGDMFILVSGKLEGGQVSFKNKQFGKRGLATNSFNNSLDFSIPGLQHGTWKITITSTVAGSLDCTVTVPGPTALFNVTTRGGLCERPWDL
jgi:hypothetical protein